MNCLFALARTCYGSQRQCCHPLNSPGYGYVPVPAPAPAPFPFPPAAHLCLLMHFFCLSNAHCRRLTFAASPHYPAPPSLSLSLPHPPPFRPLPLPSLSSGSDWSSHFAVCFNLHCTCVCLHFLFHSFSLLFLPTITPLPAPAPLVSARCLCLLPLCILMNKCIKWPRTLQMTEWMPSLRRNILTHTAGGWQMNMNKYS